MSLWDNIMSVVSGHGWNPDQGVAGPVGAKFNALGAATSLAASPVNAVANTLSLAQRTTDLASQGAAAGLIAVNPDSKDYLSLVDAWNDASRQKISPGQAFASLGLVQQPLAHPLSVENPLTHPFGVGEPDRTGLAGTKAGVSGGIDPTDPATRKAAYETRGSLGQIATFGADAVFQYYLAPPVLFGQAAKPVIATVRGAAKGRSGIQAFTNEQIAGYAEKLGPTGTGPLPVNPALETGLPRTSPVNPIADEAERLWGHVQAGNYGAIRQNSVILNSADPSQVAATIAGVKSWDELNTVLMAATGDPTAFARLKATEPVLNDALKKASNDVRDLEQTVAEWNLPKITPRGEPHPDWVATQAQLDDRRALLANLVDRNIWLRRAIGAGDEDDNGVWHTMSDQFFSPNRQLNAWRNGIAERRAARGLSPGNTGTWVSRPFKEGGKVVKVMHWFGSSVPAGFVSLSGNGRLLSRDELLASGQQAGLDQDVLWNHVRAFESAPTATEAQHAIVRFSGDVTRKVFAKVFPEVKVGSPEYDNLLAEADKWAADHGRNTVQALQDYTNTGGYLYDEVHGVGYKIPQLESQEAQLVPLPDWSDLERGLRRQKNEWTKVFDSKVVRVPEDAAALALQFWKPLILLRLGAVPKNVGESWLASYVYLSRFAGNPVTGTANIARNLNSYGADLSTRFADYYDSVPWAPYKSSMFQARAGALARQGDAVKAQRSAQRALDDLKAEMGRNPAQHVIGGRQVFKVGQERSTMSLIDEQLDAIRNVQPALDSATNDLTRLHEVDVRRARRSAGQRNVIEGQWQARGALMDEIGQVSANNVSAADKNRLAETQFQTAGSDRRFVTGRLRATGQTAQYNPDPVTHFPEWAAHATHFANTNVRNSRVALRLLRGEPIDDISTWMRTTTEGRGLMSRMPALDDHAKPAVDQYLHDLNHNLRALYPHERLQQAITDGPITEAQVRGFLEHRSDTLVPVFDDELLHEVPGDFVDHLNAFVDKMFQNLWTKPEDRLARIPLYVTIMEGQTRRGLRQYADHLATLSQPDANAFIRNIEASARERAITDVHRIVYSARQRTRLSVAGPLQAMRYIVPFYQVTANRLTYYGSQLLENPQNMARLFVGWNAIGTTKDRDGKDVVTLSLPGPVAQVAGIEDSPNLMFQKSSLNLINSGEPWYAPGFGPVVTIPMAAWLREHPAETPDWLKTAVRVSGMFPNNYYGTSWTDQFGAAWMRRWGSAGDQQQRANLWAQIYAVEVMKHNNGLRDMPTDEEITRRVDGLGFFKVIAAFALPAQPQYSVGKPGLTPPPPHSGQSAKAEMLTTMADVHSQYLAKYKQEGDTRFYQDYPEYYDYIVSLTQNPTGIQSTSAAVKRAEEHSGLVASLSDPRMGGLVTNLPDDYGKFEADAYAWQKGRPVVEGGSLVWRGSNTDAKAGYENRVISRGWKEYVAATQERDQFLKLIGKTSTQQVGAEWVKAIFAARVENITKDTSYKDSSGHVVAPWWNDYQQQDNALYAKRADDLGRILTEPGYYEKNVGVQPWLRSAAAYLRTRQSIQGILGAVQAGGGSGDINAASNAWVKIIWQAQAKQLTDADPQWAQIANSMFSHDDLSSVPLQSADLAPGVPA